MEVGQLLRSSCMSDEVFDKHLYVAVSLSHR